MLSFTFTLIAFPILSFAAPIFVRNIDQATFLKNGQDAQTWNTLFATAKLSDVCNSTDLACIGGSNAVCVDGAWQSFQCPTGTQCYALPLTRAPGTGISCVRTPTAAKKIAQSGAQGGIFASLPVVGTSITSSTLDATATPPPASSTTLAVLPVSTAFVPGAISPVPVTAPSVIAPSATTSTILSPSASGPAAALVPGVVVPISTQVVALSSTAPVASSILSPAAMSSNVLAIPPVTSTISSVTASSLAATALESASTVTEVVQVTSTVPAAVVPSTTVEVVLRTSTVPAALIPTTSL